MALGQLPRPSQCLKSVETDTQSNQKGPLGLGQWVRNLFCTITDVAV